MSDKAITSDILAGYEVTPTQFFGDLCQMVELRQPVMLWGQPGVGKSAVCKDAAAKLGYKFVDIRALLMDPVDLRGLPIVDAQAGTTAWATPAFLPPTDSGEQYLVLLDEITACPPAMQASLYQAIWDRKIGEYEFPAGASIVAAGNRVTDRGVAVAMPTPLRSRFHHVTLRSDPAEWVDWAIDHDLHEDVIYFVMTRPELLNRFDPQSKDQTFPCPRTWEMVSRMLERYDQFTAAGLTALLAGTIGVGAATEFSAFLKVKSELPHPQTVIDDPDGASTFDSRPDVLLALCGSLYRAAEDSNFDAIATYAMRIRPEVGEFLRSSCIRRNPDLQRTRANVRMLARNAS